MPGFFVPARNVRAMAARYRRAFPSHQLPHFTTTARHLRNTAPCPAFSLISLPFCTSARLLPSFVNSSAGRAADAALSTLFNPNQPSSILLPWLIEKSDKHETPPANNSPLPSATEVDSQFPCHTVFQARKCDIRGPPYCAHLTIALK